MTPSGIPSYMFSAAGREDILAGTLGRWAEAGGGGAPVVVRDPTPPEARGLTRIFGGWRALLARAVADSPAPHVLLLEFDLDFAPGGPRRRGPVNYPENGGEHATTLELLHKHGTEEEYGHTVPVIRPSQTAGPFVLGETITFLTRVANRTNGNVLLTPKVVVIES